MSTSSSPTRVAEAIARCDCPRCGAPAGRRCQSLTRRHAPTMTRPHAERMAAARKAGY